MSGSIAFCGIAEFVKAKVTIAGSHRISPLLLFSTRSEPSLFGQIKQSDIVCFDTRVNRNLPFRFPPHFHRSNQFNISVPQGHRHERPCHA